MNLDVSILDILFRRINPEEVYEALWNDRSMSLKNLCMAKAELTMPGFSYEEKSTIIRKYLGDDEIKLWHSQPRQFEVLSSTADKVLEAGETSPVCRYAQTLIWRELYLLLGQDLFTTSWLAWQDSGGPRPRWFSWPAVIPVNDPILNQITVGLAENHMHLMAGASTFAITWACLTNHPEAIFNNGGIRVFLQPVVSRDAITIWSVEKRVLFAACLRLILFRASRGLEADAMGAFRRFADDYLGDEWAAGTLSERIDHMSALYGTLFPQPIGGAQYLDYAFTEDLYDQVDEHYRLLASERQFMYSCFCCCYNGTFTEREQWLFYLYLLLKSQFRGEIVQVNKQVGFHNFHDYDDRKAVFWKKAYSEYLFEDYRQAINANLREGIHSLEARLSPGLSTADDLVRVFDIDRASAFADGIDIGTLDSLSWGRHVDAGKNHFYVFHFPKDRDRTLPRSASAEPVYRHQDFREEVRIKAIALSGILASSEYFARRVRGIDACSFEIVCRPEVFGPAFRFLRGFPVERYRGNGMSKVNPKLGLTYHVGEDFLDIADGLRAADEALCFLGFRRGDRLGHATVLGVDPRLHYERKNRQLAMTKQEGLDICVWVLYRAGELGVYIPPILKSKLQRRAQTLFDEIYRDKLHDQGSGLGDYFLSMKLRGDDPRCYARCEYIPPHPNDGFDMFCAVDQPELWPLRRERRVVELCFMYHYCHGALNTGYETDVMDVDDDYIGLMYDMQRAMRNRVDDMGVRIESNPSSNVLIGTFGAYRTHPILTFYNRGLGIEQNDVQMHVSINTDDPGVFDTSLTFEYALLARALQEMKDERGVRLNTDRDIERYLRDIRRMGREQTFAPIR